MPAADAESFYRDHAMKNVLRHAVAGFLLMAGFHVGTSEASVIINGTRVVYPSQQREVTVKLQNQGKTPALVQVWMDAGDEKATPEEAKVPFTLAPPIFRMEPGKGQAVRMVYTKEPLPTDKESIYWLNVLEVPPKAADPDGSNLLQFAFRTRIKVLFRPANLPGSAADAPDKLTWKLTSSEDGKGYALQVSNPTPYYVNFANVGLKVGDRSIPSDGGMVAPGGTTSFPLKQLTARPTGDVQAQYRFITDLGALTEKLAPLAP
jgi:chaperone protein EcpD